VSARAALRSVLAALAVALACAGIPARAATAVVTYLSGATVYLGAGQRDGLLAGTRLSPDQDAASPVLQAFEVSPRRAACRVLEGKAGAIRVGDRFRFEPAADPGGGGSSASAPARKPWGGRGRLGIRYLLTQDGINDGTDFQQPALDALVDAPSLFGTPWGARLDVRARRTIGTEDDVDQTRVYALYGGYDKPGPGVRFALGRQYAPDLGNVSTFDGALAAYDSARWSAGGFLGVQPAPDFGYSNDVREFGGFGSWRGAPGTPHHWTLSSGLVASYQKSEINREFLFVHGTWVGPRLGGFFTQELDLNRGWKRDAGESTLEITSTFASVRVRATDWMDVFGGADSRRNVLLYRNFVSPETEFDDAFRRGYWLGADMRSGQHVRFGLSGRTADGGSAGNADSLTGSVTVDRMTRADLSARLRATWWSDDRLEGWLYAAGFGGQIGERFRLGIDTGLRAEDSLLNPVLSDDVWWLGLTFDADLGRRFFATLALDRSEGDYEDVTQLYASFAYRF